MTQIPFVNLLSSFEFGYFKAEYIEPCHSEQGEEALLLCLTTSLLLYFLFFTA